MIRLISAGACALFLIGCQGEPAGDSDGNSPAASSAAVTDASSRFELGKPI